MPAKKQLAPELIAQCKSDYEETLTPVNAICARMGVSRSGFYARVSGWKWKRRRYGTAVVSDHPVQEAPAPEQEAPAAPLPALEPVTPEALATIYARVVRAVRIEMDTIETVLKTLRPEREAQSERATRILATVNKTLCEIADMTRPDEMTPPDETDDDAVPRDIEQFRHELAQRIRELVGAQRNRTGASAGATVAE